MRRFAIPAVLLCATAGHAQVAMEPARYRPLVHYLDPRPGETSLSCEVSPRPPVFNLGLRFQAGYLVRVPLSQFTGAGHHWDVMVEIRPEEGGPPAYFAQQFALPRVPSTKIRGGFAGGYLIGEGKYHARFAMFDERGRVCRKGWNIDVKPRPYERNEKALMPPNTVSELTWENILQVQKHSADARARNITVLLDVAPLSPFRTRLGPADHLVLLTLVSAVLERIPTSHVRLVAFNLDQQRELFRRDSLGPGDLRELAGELQSLELGTVDYHVLQHRGGYQDLLQQLVEREEAASPPSDEVLFLGPAVRYKAKMPPGSVPKIGEGGPHFYYLQYYPALRGRSWTLPDTLDSLVSRLKGKKFEIRTPADLEKAVAHIL